MSADNPILNSPYVEPLLHYNTDSEGSLDYTDIRKGRRIFKADSAVIPTRQTGQKEVFEWNEDAEEYISHIINLCRKEIGLWRAANYPNTTRVTKELLTFWFNNPERLVTKKLFFAQQEAVETAIWINEVAEKSNAGQHILNLLRNGQQTVSEDPADQLPRIAFKMATGSGKTVVMACLICYHYFNRQEYRNDTRFADYFLIVAPGVTIKSRLGVLFVDTKNKNPKDIEDYYRVRGLIPANMEHRLENLNARLVITNYHTFEPKILQGNKRSLYRHEHIAPETLIKNLYKVTETQSNQMDLFSVNELSGNALDKDEIKKVSEYYHHQDGWTNRLIQGDSHFKY